MYTSTKFNSAKFNNLLANEHKLLLSEHRKIDTSFLTLAL